VLKIFSFSKSKESGKVLHLTTVATFLLCHIGYPRLYDAFVRIFVKLHLGGGMDRMVGGSKNKIRERRENITYLSVAALQGLNLS
jgi:hypothetical protein